MFTYEASAHGLQEQLSASATVNLSSQQPPQRVRLLDITKLRVKKRVYPVYPKGLREQHVQGFVVMDVTIDRRGKVIDVKLISGNAELGHAAMVAAKQCEYQPYLVDKQPVEVIIQTQVTFTLSGG